MTSTDAMLRENIPTDYLRKFAKKNLGYIEHTRVYCVQTRKLDSVRNSVRYPIYVLEGMVLFLVYTNYRDGSNLSLYRKLLARKCHRELQP